MSEDTRGELVAESETGNVDRDIHTSPEATPVFATGGTRGELVGSGQPQDGIIQRWRSKVERAVATFKAAGRTSMLVLSSNWQIMRIPVRAGDIDLARYATLESLSQLRTLYIRSRQRVTEARARLVAAEEYARLVDELAEQDNYGGELALLKSDVPPSGAPEYPVMVRCKALRPITRYYLRSHGELYARWYFLHNGHQLEVALMDVFADGRGAILDVPEPMVESLKAEGLIALAKPGTPLQTSNGKLLGGN
jgi:hypothetical protein